MTNWTGAVCEANGIDIHYAQVKSAGTSRLGESHDYGDGYRGYSARDLGGNLRSLALAQFHSTGTGRPGGCSAPDRSDLDSTADKR